MGEVSCEDVALVLTTTEDSPQGEVPVSDGFSEEEVSFAQPLFKSNVEECDEEQNCTDSEEQNCMYNEEQNCMDNEEQNCMDNEEQNCMDNEEQNCMDNEEQNCMEGEDLYKQLFSDENKCDSQSNIADESEQLPPSVRLKKLAESDAIHNRQVAARKILDTLTKVVDDPVELHGVVSVMCMLAEDEQGTVRSELVEHIPDIATFCRNQAPNLEFLIRQQLVPTVVNLTEDRQIQVRTAGRAALFSLFERNLVDDSLTTEWICPFIAHQALNMSSTEERRMEAVNLMIKMAPLVGKDVTLSCFLEHFASLAEDMSILVKKACAMKFGEFCHVVGTKATEELLLPKFLDLCASDAWGIRKACADAFVDMARVLTLSTRKSALPSIFIKLLCDVSRWVRFSAYQNLGRLIATFADPSKTGLLYNEEDGSVTCFDAYNTPSANVQDDGCSVSKTVQCENSSESPVNHFVVNDIEQKSSEDANKNEKLEESLSKDANGDENCEPSLQDNGVGSTCPNGHSDEGVLIPSEFICHRFVEYNDIDTDVEHSNCDIDAGSGDVSSSQKQPKVHEKVAVFSSEEGDGVKNVSPQCEAKNETPLVVTFKDGHFHVHVDNESIFNNFQYWRTPIPEIEIDVDIGDNQETNVCIRAAQKGKFIQRTKFWQMSMRVARKKSRESNYSIDLKSNLVNGEPPRQGSEAVDKVLVQTTPVSTTGKMDNLSSNSESAVQKYSTIQSFYDAKAKLVDEEESFRRHIHYDLSSSYQEISNSYQDMWYPDMSLEIGDIMPKEEVNVNREQMQCLGVYKQDIVPPELLEKYISMVEPMLAHVIDTEITRHCALYLPAVVYTLGRKNWCCVQKVCELLASDMQWKVRRLVAASLHQLAILLGDEITVRDLLPLFFALVNDLDEVRGGIVNNLALFLKHVWPEERRNFLPKIRRFLQMDNTYNWRFLHTAAQQLVQITNLYSSQDVHECIYPIAMALIRDRVCEVRLEAVRLIAVIVLKIAQDTETVNSVLKDLEEKFMESNTWLRRQTYILLCQRIALEGALPAECFAEHFGPHLLNLADDRVRNIRIAVARCLESLPFDYLLAIAKLHGQWLTEVIDLLNEDRDRDVKAFAALSAEKLNNAQRMLSPV